ncbi:MAG: ATPase, T2SS/T4P/T4SS family [Myxococcota bacterium]|nr:ATPase, T2SS/T4P/T4SS family [Myxococcota bacterium]
MYTILCVDDEKNVLTAMRRTLRNKNYNIITAQSGAAGLQILAKDPAHVVISDFQMPDMNGAEFLSRVLSKYPETIRIMLTGCSDISAVMQAINSGAVYRFITKPANKEELRLTVKLALEQWELTQENEALKSANEKQKWEIAKLSRFVTQHNSRLGKILVDADIIAAENLEHALAKQRETGRMLPEILLDQNLIDETAMIQAVVSTLGIECISIEDYPILKELTSLMPQKVCQESLLVPLKLHRNVLTVAMCDPTDVTKIDELSFITGAKIKPVVAFIKDIKDRITDLYGDSSVLDGDTPHGDPNEPHENIEFLVDDGEEELELNELIQEEASPQAIKIINTILNNALRMHTSDIHIEPKERNVRVRFRIDGLLRDVFHLPLHVHASLVSRIKVMCDLDIAERRKPQDGRVTAKTSIMVADMRISILPTINGEKVVMRILDRTSTIKQTKDLGLNPKELKNLLAMVKQPQGIVLTTGPTGSGKTTTLYSLLNEVATNDRNFITIEDPVEYHMGMAEQVHIREKIGLHFPVVLRAILRQDPDVIMIGEIRDSDTAEVAFNAAMTGHLVLSTLHTNSAVTTITRLRDLGIKPYLINEALTGIVAQRLLRRICTHCKVDDEVSTETLLALKLHRDSMDFSPKKGTGCSKCKGTGYAGRVGIFEIFQMNSEIKKMIAINESELNIINTARASGMKNLLDAGLEKIKEGVTSCEEVLRVLGPQNIMTTICPGCDAVLEAYFKYCPFCSFQINNFCSGCGVLLMKNWKTCPFCGASAKDTNKKHAPRAQQRGQRHQTIQGVPHPAGQ